MAQAKKVTPATFGPAYPGDYPSEMRTQLWPLCCGARIISGFKHAGQVTVDELVAEIEAVLQSVPDHQVYQHEQMKPKLTFLTLNQGQTQSPKIMSAVEKAGFVQIGTASPRGSVQSFFIRDDSKSWKAVI